MLKKRATVTLIAASMAFSTSAHSLAKQPTSTDLQKETALVTYKANPDRIVDLTGSINSELANKVANRLYELARKDPKKDIIMRINSDGGTVSDGWKIIDAMRAVPNRVHVVVSGQAASMAAIIAMVAGTGKRYAHKHAEFMLHQPSLATSGNASDIGETAKNINGSLNAFANELARMSGWDYEQIRRFFIPGMDIYLTAEEARDFGFIDVVIDPGIKVTPPSSPKVPEGFCDKNKASWINPFCASSIFPTLSRQTKPAAKPKAAAPKLRR